MIETMGQSAGGGSAAACNCNRQRETISHSGISRNAQKAKNSQPIVRGSQGGMVRPYLGSQVVSESGEDNETRSGGDTEKIPRRGFIVKAQGLPPRRRTLGKGARANRILKEFHPFTNVELVEVEPLTCHRDVLPRSERATHAVTKVPSTTRSASQPFRYTGFKTSIPSGGSRSAILCACPCVAIGSL